MAINEVGLLYLEDFGEGNEMTTYDQQLVIHVRRMRTTANAILGYLEVNGIRIGYTLELPWRDNVRYASSIPEGTYSGFIRHAGDEDRWRIQLVGVTGRSAIQIHTGNVPAHTKGCILVGTALSEDGSSLKGGSSVPARNAIRNAFYGTPNPVSTPDRSVVITIGH